jgi:phosphatidylserine/phosphatidylglycerophosphate/cardiolipin synthase-like enzyme
VSSFAQTGKQFRGVVDVKGGQVFLHAGGIAVELLNADSPVADLFSSRQGLISTVFGEQSGATIVNARPARVQESAMEPPGPDPALDEILAVARQQESKLRSIPGVVGVRPGFRTVNGAQTAEPALVVLTAGKHTLQELGIPQKMGDINVDVQQADPLEQLSEANALPFWTQLLTGSLPEAAPHIGYVPPTTVTLDECKVRNITCHVGPDAGWTTLGPFLEGTTGTLTVAMYDFDADQIVTAMADLGKSTDAKFQLILQEDKAAETGAVNKLKSAWRDRFEYTRAVVSGPNRIFNNSFHTKVAVRDSKAFWLSSGNWSPNSQPVIPGGAQPTIYNKGNREWHVIIEDETLAGIFEKFIQYDFKMASEVEAPEAAPAMPDLLVPESFFAEAEAAVVQPAPFEPQTFPTAAGAAITVQPLLTPDNYGDFILDLINSAQETLWMQYAYIRAPKDDDKYKRLIEAVASRIKAGVDVRVIVDGRNQIAAHTQSLIALGWGTRNIRLQRSKVHNKGILVDSKIAVVGSQNWSSDGTQYNRDASVILHSPAIARYFGKVFEFDWDNLTRPVSEPEITPMLAPESGPTPAGMVRIPWSAWYGA